MRNFIKFYTLLFLLALPATASSINDYYYQLDINNGLSQNSVTCILYDSNGVLWIGTRFGLNSFNQYEMKRFLNDKSNPSSLPGNYIYFIKEDSQKNIWISTDKGIVRYRSSDKTFLPLSKTIKETIAAYMEYGNSIYLSKGNVLYRYNKENNTLRKFILKGMPNLRISYILKYDNRQLLLVSRRKKAFLYDTVTSKFTAYHLPIDLAISNVLKGSDGNYYIGTFSYGLYCFDKNWKKKYAFSTANGLSNDIILDLMERDGKIWVATDGGGINIIDKKTLQIKILQHLPGISGSLPVSSITCLYKDDQDNVFAGSVRGGMIAIREVGIKRFEDAPIKSPYGLSDKTVISMYEEPNKTLWIGTDGGGINSFNPETKSFKHFPGLLNTKICSITEFSEDELIISVYNDKTYLFNKKTGNCRPFIIVNPEITKIQCRNEYVVQVFKLTDDLIYCLSRDVYVYNLRTKKFSKVTTKESPSFLEALFPVYSDENESFFFNYKGNKLLRISHKEGTMNTVLKINDKDIILSACRDKKGFFWIGTDNGLFYFNLKTKAYRKVNTNLFTNVSSLFCDNKDRLWIGAQNMLFSFDSKRSKLISIDESDGFSPNELLYMYHGKQYSNDIYLGGVCGLVCIDGNIALDKNILPVVTLSDITVNGISKVIDTGNAPSEIKVPWDYSSLSIKVSSIEKDIFRKKLYKFKIEGINKEDIITYNPVLQLRNLQPGEYRITASCNTKGGDWSTPRNILEIVITPPWYRNTIVVSLLYFVILLIIIYIIMAVFRRQDRKMKRAMMMHEQKINKEKIEFLVNISHELRTPLTLAYTPLKHIITHKEWDNKTSNMEKSLNYIFKQLQWVLELVNMAFDQNNLHYDEEQLQKSYVSVNDWVKKVVDSFSEVSEEKGISLQVEYDTANPLASFDIIKCRLVLSNLIMDAIKFSEGENTIIIKTESNNELVRISLKTSYKAMENKNEIDHNFIDLLNNNEMGNRIELAYSKRIIEKHGGRIGIVNDNDTSEYQLFFEIPINNKESAKEESLNEEPILEGSVSNAQPSKEQFDTLEFSMLIVEDNKEIQSLLKRILNTMFKHLYIANNGAEAYIMVKSYIPDIIISDIVMPQMDGLQLCEKLKADVSTSHIPIILLTARGDINSKNIGYKSGADAYMSKPFDEETLTTVIVNLLKSRETIKKKYGITQSLNIKKGEKVNNLDEDFMLRFDKLINDNISIKNLNIDFLTEKMNMSRTPLYNKIRALSNMGIKDYVNLKRINKAADLLLNTNMIIIDVAENTGFSNPKYFSTLFKQIKGKTPSQFRQDGKATDGVK